MTEGHENAPRPALAADCRTTFRALLPRVVSALHVHRPLPKVTATVSQTAAFGARVRRPGGHPGRVIVEFDAGTLTALHAAIESHAVSLLRAVLADLTSDAVDEAALLTVLYDTTLTFIQLHELFHVLGGHLDYRHEQYGLAELSELSLGFTGSSGPSEALAYALELEADGNAVDVLIGKASFEGLLEQASALGLAPAAESSASDLDGPARQFAFRVLAVAGWVAIALIEAARLESTEHPSPAARLLAMLASVLKWYAELTELQVNADGSTTQVLETQHIEGIRECLFEVIKPVAVELWIFPDTSVSRRLGLEGDGEAVGQLLQELGDLLLRQKAKTPAGRQLEAIERIRIEILEALAPHRFFTVELGWHRDDRG